MMKTPFIYTICKYLHVELSSILGGSYVFSDPICSSFLAWFGHDFPPGQFASVRSPYRGQRHDILDFSYGPLSRVLHVTLTNWQRFRFQFHLRSSPSAFSEYMDISRQADYFKACYTVLRRPNEVETAVHRPVAILGFQFGLYYVVAPLSFVRSISLASLFAILSIFG